MANGARQQSADHRARRGHRGAVAPHPCSAGNGNRPRSRLSRPNLYLPPSPRSRVSGRTHRAQDPMRLPQAGTRPDPSRLKKISISISPALGISATRRRILGRPKRRGFPPFWLKPGTAASIAAILTKQNSPSPTFQRRQPSFLTSIRRSRSSSLLKSPQWRSGDDWFVGGAPSAGKSTVAATLERELRLQGRRARIIHTDRWIQDDDDRHALASFDMAVSKRPSRRRRSARKPIRYARCFRPAARAPFGDQTGAGRSPDLGRRFCRGARGVSWPDRSRNQRRLERSRPT